jgi:chemotaxis regulatin CheY-phosphate phosphatase CheZ
MKNILAENMRRFGTKNLRESIDTAELDAKLEALDENDLEGFIEVMTAIENAGPIDKWLKKVARAIRRKWYRMTKRFKYKLDQRRLLNASRRLWDTMKHDIGL